jgi:Kef-type K+ transport system membrane component KefB
MMVVGSHIVIESKSVKRDSSFQFLHGALAQFVVGLLSIIGAVAISHIFHLSNWAVIAVLLSSSSAALILPIIEELTREKRTTLWPRDFLYQIALADLIAIALLPLVISESGRSLNINGFIGILLLTICGGVIYYAQKYLSKNGFLERFRHYSHDKKFGLELRTSLAVLFFLVAIAQKFSLSIMTAGFVLGLALGRDGISHRLNRQIFGLSEGFFTPFFYIWLGGQLDFRSVFNSHKGIYLALALYFTALFVHIFPRVLLRFLSTSVSIKVKGLAAEIKSGILAASQLGVPVAIVTIGTTHHVISPQLCSAIMCAAILTIITAALSTLLMVEN